MKRKISKISNLQDLKFPKCFGFFQNFRKNFKHFEINLTIFKNYGTGAPAGNGGVKLSRT